MPTMDTQKDALFDHLANKNWKQALGLCDKYLKKAPKSDFLLITRIDILIQWAENSRREQGLKELESLLERKPPVTDFDALNLLGKLLDSLEPNVQFTATQKQTWQRAAVSHSHDERFHTLWYRSKFDQGDARGAQQACMVWMKNFPKERKPFFLYAVTTYLISEETTDEREKTLMQTLLYRNLSKAAQYTLQDSSDVTGRQIKSYQDVCLLLRVYRAQGRYAEATEIVKSKRVGMEAYETAEKWELAREFMDLLELNQAWTQLREWCHGVLAQAHKSSFESPDHGFGRLGNDFKTWQRFIRANSNDDPIHNSSGTEELIRSFCTPSGKAHEHNGQLAQLLFFSTEVFEGRKSQLLLLEAIVRYFRNFCSKTACFLDLKSSLPYLDVKGQQRLLSHGAQHAHNTRAELGEPESSMIFWITGEINILKLEYHLVISRDQNSRRMDLLSEFVSNCLRLYRASLKFGFELPVSDRRPGDDAALLAAMGLIRLFKAGRKHALLQCIVVLEHALLQSQHNYDAVLILVRLYMFLGAGSLAMDRYAKLSIKNLQHATVSWVLYTRLSSIHPHPTKHTANRRSQIMIDPMENLKQGSDWYRSAGANSLKVMHSMQDNGQWNMVLDSQATTRAVFNSFAKILLYVELRRIERFQSPSAPVSKEQCAEIPERVKETRDRNAFPDFESGELTFEQHLPAAGTSIEPDDAWLHNELMLAWFWALLHKNESSVLNIERLNVLYSNCSKNPDILTHAEHALANVVKLLHQLYTLYTLRDQFGEKDAKNFIEDFFEKVELWLTDSSKNLELSLKDATYASLPLASDFRIPFWSLFHGYFSHLEQCIFILRTLEYVHLENKRKPIVDNKWFVGKMKRIKNECANLSLCVSRSATTLRDEIRAQPFLRRIDEMVLGIGSDQTEDNDPIAEELRKLGPLSELKKICQDLKDSWIDGLEGVIGTKIA